MPYTINWKGKEVHSHFYGTFTPEVHIEALHKLFGDPRIDDIKLIIGDFSDIDGEYLSDKDVEYPVAMTTGAASYIRNIKVGLVAVDKKIIKLCQDYIELSSHVNPTWDVKLFDSVDKAREWGESSPVI